MQQYKQNVYWTSDIVLYLAYQKYKYSYNQVEMYVHLFWARVT
jgi:hypothetical protein